jgi:general secretion pathway protein D
MLILWLLTQTTHGPVESKPVEFKFRNADIDSVLQYLSRQTGFLFVNDAGVEGTIDAVSEAPVPRERLIDFVNAVLQPKGAALLRGDGSVIKIVTLEEYKRRHVEIHQGTDPSKVAGGDRIVTQIVPLKNLNILEFDAGLKTLVPPTAQIARDQSNNALIVTDTADNIRRFLEFVTRLDGPEGETLQTRVLPLKAADAAEVARIAVEAMRRDAVNLAPAAGLNRMWFGTEGRLRPRNAVNDSIKVIPDPRSNSVVAVGTEQNLRLIESLVSDMDRRAAEAALRDEETTLVVRLKNASSKEVAEIVKSVYRDATAMSGASAPPGAKQAPVAPAAPGPGPETPAPPQKKPEPVEAEPDDRVVVIRARRDSIPRIQSLIRELDAYRPQVLIEALIAEVTLDRRLQYGVEGFWEGLVKTGGDSAIQRVQSTFGGPAAGFSYLLSADRFRVGLRALAEDGLLKVLATPRILALDGRPAEFSVGRRVPIITHSRQNPDGNIFNTVEYVDVGIILRVLPKINPDGMVVLSVHPEVSDLAAQTEGVEISPGARAPTFVRNAVDTQVTVRTGQTVVLGGLIRESEDVGRTQVPVLGDLPILGSLFSRTSIDKGRRELVAFLTPRVVYSQAELEELTRLETARLRLIDPRSLEQETKQWLDDLER